MTGKKPTPDETRDDLAEFHYIKAKELFESGRYEEAERNLRKAIEAEPRSARYWGSLGTLLMRVGRFDESREALYRALPLDPKRAGTYFDLAFGGKITPADRSLIESMEGLARATDLSIEDRKHLQYALGKSYDDLGEYASAMPHFDAANGIARAERAVDFGSVAASFEALKQTYTEQAVKDAGMAGHPSRKPVLIVGMMRSGTTLVEQILSSHPDVFGGGELHFWMQNRGKAVLPTGIVKLGAISEIAIEYLELLDKLAPNKAHVTDKMPQNFLALGLFHLAFPQAKIINCRRNPIDTCLSIYFTPNDTLPGFFHDKSRLAEFYRLYLSLMDHWRSVLPKEKMLEVDYEEIIEDQEGFARRLLSFLDLPWNKGVLRHNRSGRAVQTASLWQVRQPIYRSSLNRREHYEQWLGPLSELS